MSTLKGFLTLADVAQRLRVRQWQIRRLYGRKLLPEPPRLGQNRLYVEEDVPLIEAALKEAGYLKK